MLTPPSPLTDYLARIREKFGANSGICLEIEDNQYGGLYQYGTFDRRLIIGFTSLTQLCDFLNKD